MSGRFAVFPLFCGSAAPPNARPPEAKTHAGGAREAPPEGLLWPVMGLNLC